MKKIIIHSGESLERTYIQLVTAMVESETVCYADFNGKRIYSNKSLDEAFKAVTGKDYMSFTKEQNKEIKAYHKKEVEIRKNKMTEIKFKGQVIGGHGKWIYGNSLIQNDAGTKYIGDNIAPSKINESNVHEVVHVCVFTGSKDCDGNEIYEGDILGGCNGSINGIEWSQSPFEVIYKNNEFNIPLWGTYGKGDSTHYLRVIGNRFDNPELLNNKGK